LYRHGECTGCGRCRHATRPLGRNALRIRRTGPAGTNADADTLRDWCRSHLAGYKVPGRFIFMPIPRSSTGKVQKFVLREQARAIAQASVNMEGNAVAQG